MSDAKEAPPARPRRGSRRRLLLTAGGLALWTLWACYPNPWVLGRNFQRYLRFPVDTRAAGRLSWRLPDDPREIEELVRIAIGPEYDWQQYGVPWYMPRPLEVLASRRGDCESQAVVLASLLAAKGIPFQVKASFSHIWIDYPGKLPTAQENDDIAYLRRVKGRYRFRFPRLVDWKATFAVEREALWGAMPPARRLTLFFGWALVLWAALFTFARPSASEARRWRPGVLFVSPSGWRRLGRRLFSRAWLLAAAAALALTYWESPQFRIEAPATWAAVAMGSLLAAAMLETRRSRWLWVRPGEGQMLATAALGLFRRSRKVPIGEIAALRLRGEPEREGRFALEAELRGKRRVSLLHYCDQVAARRDLAALRSLLGKPARLCLGKGEIELAQPTLPLGPRPALPRPEGCRLVVEKRPGSWSLALPGLPRGERWWLAGFALAACGAALSASAAFVRAPGQAWLWALWLLSVAIVASVLSFLIPRGEEILLAVYGARLELGAGEIRFRAPGRQETLKVADIISVELHPRDHDTTALLVAKGGVISLRGLGRAEDQEWVRATVEEALVRAQQQPSPPLSF
jgi:hypothetical protein